jgi:hypothetical protein
MGKPLWKIGTERIDLYFIAFAAAGGRGRSLW